MLENNLFITKNMETSEKDESNKSTTSDDNQIVVKKIDSMSCKVCQSS